MGDKLTHTNAQGNAHMVDVGDKAQTRRRAVAFSKVSMSKETLVLIQNNQLKKGDVLATARLAGIMAAKRTPDLIPLCHTLALNTVSVDLALNQEPPTVDITATVECHGKTGVEMEALTAASITALTVYDMIKAVERDATIGPTYLLEKSGGKTGDWQR